MKAVPNLANLVAAIATVACCNICIGLTFQLNPLLLEQAGWSKATIGAVVAMGPLGVLITSWQFPQLVKHFGHKKIIAAAIIGLLGSLLTFNAVAFEMWFLVRFVFGAAIALLFTASEAWLLSFSTDENRGRVFGFYTTVLTMTFAVGPLVIPFTGINGWLPWLTGAAFILPGLLILMLVKPGHIQVSEETHGIFGVMRKEPLLFAAILSFTLFEAVQIPFFAIFGAGRGVGLNEASRILGFGIVTCALLYYPFGLLSDRLDRTKLEMVSAFLTVALSLLLIPAITHWSVWPLNVALRLFAIGPYIIAFAIIGARFKGAEMLSAAAGVSMLWGVGGLIGPPVTGFAIDQFGVNAMPIILALIFLLLIFGFVANRFSLLHTRIA
jgi:MFS family permease